MADTAELAADSTSTIEIDDGRTLRRKRNRDAVISALIDLVREGDLNPTVEKIADRAAVSHRSIYRYFDDLDDLARTAIETEVRAALPLAVIPNVGEGPLDDRIDGMLASRLRVLTRTHRLIRVANAKSNVLPEIDRGLSMVADMTLDQFRRHFKPELDQMEPVLAEHVACLLSAQMGFEGYDHMRRMLHRSDGEIIDAWRIALNRFLR